MSFYSFKWSFLLSCLLSLQSCSNFTSYYKTTNGKMSKEREMIKKTKIFFTPYDESSRSFKKKLSDLFEKKNEELSEYEYVLILGLDHATNMGSISPSGFMTSLSLIVKGKYKLFKLDKVYGNEDFAKLDKIFEEHYSKILKRGIKFDSFKKKDQEYKVKGNHNSLFFLNYMSEKDSRRKVKEFDKFDFISNYFESKNIELISSGFVEDINAVQINGNNLLSTKESFAYNLDKISINVAENIFYELLLNAQ